ncbi:MAG: S-methyl-5-thioribose-1-phosphate isomerase [Pseudomonadota bacterium]
MQLIKTISWEDNKVVMLDQRALPAKEVYFTYDNYQDVAQAIKDMVIRGAPAIGVAAAMGVALGISKVAVGNFDTYYDRLCQICDVLAQTRPTAVNLFWAIERMKSVAKNNREKVTKEITNLLIKTATDILKEDIEANYTLGKYGQALIKDGSAILTHCNAGALATGGYGTALGVIYAAHDAGKKIRVYADETRPRLQGAKLTAWELKKHGVDVTVITDNMAASLMKAGKIDGCIVGADRIASNGDTANKIGTYGVAVLAKFHNIPFYVAAPWSTVDMNIKSGDEIPIEERSSDEVTTIGAERLTPDAVKVINPAFDVTPHELITAIITERGIAKAPFFNTGC